MKAPASRQDGAASRWVGQVDVLAGLCLAAPAARDVDGEQRGADQQECARR